MSNETNTAPASSESSSDVVAVKKLTLSGATLRDALRAVQNNESSNWNLVTSVVAMTVDAIARNMHDGIEPGTVGKGKTVPAMVETAKRSVFREIKVSTVLAGAAPYLNCAEGIARIAAMPKDDSDKKRQRQLRNLRRAQAELLVDAAWFMNGDALYNERFDPKAILEEFSTATRKAHNESFKLASKYSGFIVDWFWNSENEFIQGYANRVKPDHKEGDATPFIPLEVEDLKAIRAKIAAEFGENMTQLEESYRAGRPKNKTRTSVIERLRTMFEGLSDEERTAFLQYANNKHAELLVAAANAKAAVGSDEERDDDIEDAIQELAA